MGRQTLMMRLSNKHCALVCAAAMVFLLLSPAAGLSEQERPQNMVTLIDQQDRMIECRTDSEVPVVCGKSPLTGESSREEYQPVLVEYNNENGGTGVTAPFGICKASLIYEYQMNTNGTMGICALFQDTLPEQAGPVADASVGGVMIQSDWQCGYVYHGIPAQPDGQPSVLGASIRNWLDNTGTSRKGVLFPADVGRFKAWKKYFTKDYSVITEQNQLVQPSGIRTLLDRNGNQPVLAAFRFGKEADIPDGIPVNEVDISTSSRTFRSGFVYDPETGLYSRYAGDSAYCEAENGTQLTVRNVIIQRVDYMVADSQMAPNTFGRGNAEIFTHGQYIEGYWVRESSETHTRFFDSEGEPVTLLPGTTFISMQSPHTAVVLIN